MVLEDLITRLDVVDLLGKICIPLIIGSITYAIAKKNINAVGVTQFRQKWIDNLRESISLFIARAEMISLLAPDEVEEESEDEETEEVVYNDDYSEHFKELVQMQHRIELMLNPDESDHNEIVELLGKIREWVHEENISQEAFEEKLDNLINELLVVSKRVLKREWKVVKKGK